MKNIGENLEVQRMENGGLLPIFEFLSRQSFLESMSRHGPLCRDRAGHDRNTQSRMTG